MEVWRCGGATSDVSVDSSRSAMEDLVVEEYESVEVEDCAANRDVFGVVMRRYGDYLDVAPPSPSTGGRWRIRNEGYVGVLPLPGAGALYLQPKGPVANVWRMLDAVGEMPEVARGEVEAETVDDFIERLVRLLAKMVRKRARRGLYREYVRREEAVPHVRGRIDVSRHLRAPHRTKVPCRFDEHRADVEENRILAWTLYRLARSGVCSDAARREVQKAYRRMSGQVTLAPVTPADCEGRTYNRQNEDYRRMHGLCRFLLAHTGPGHRAGDEATVPFVVSMPGLFERYLVARLREDAAGRDDVRIRANVVRNYSVTDFRMDAVVENATTGEPVAVLDAKYKYGESPKASDVQQVVAYATALGCRRAVLVYPDADLAGRESTIGGVRVQTRALPLTGRGSARLGDWGIG